MLDEPLRGPTVRRAGAALPPVRMPLLRGTRPLKRWRWLGVFSPAVLLCVAEARVGPVPRRWWAVAFPDGTLAEGARGVALEAGRVRVRDRGAAIDLELGDTAPVEVLSPAGRVYAWTAKRAPLAVRGSVRAGDRRHELDGPFGFLDESAGYHERHTAWRWSAGIGTATDGRAVAWNLVAGLHDGNPSERTLWIDGEPRELGRTTFADDLSSVETEGHTVTFAEWSRRAEDTRLGPLRSRYAQPFGQYSGSLAGGLELRQAHGVMEDHDAWW